MQSSTAMVELFESVELWGKGPSSSFAALQFVSRRLDLGIVNDVRFIDGAPVHEPGLHALKSAASGSEIEASDGELTKEPRALMSVSGYDGHCRPDADAMKALGGGNPLSKAGGVAEGAGLAHDAGNLLGALSLYSELLAVPGVLNEEYREYAAELRLLSQRSSALIARLVERAQSLATEKECELTSLPDVVTRCRGLLSRIAGQRVEATFGYGNNRLVNVPGEVVERILTNLVKNAAEAMGEDRGSISVHVTGAGDAAKPIVVLTVSDQGAGMTENTLRSLGESGVPDADGRGIGFRVVRELAALSDGLLSVSSRPGQGTSVSVEWRSIEQVEVEVGASTRRVLRGEAGWIAC
jgi:Histidine kinase-, DNA gyrase B-, and HSP90-like ATPase